MHILGPDQYDEESKERPSNRAELESLLGERDGMGAAMTAAAGAARSPPYGRMFFPVVCLKPPLSASDAGNTFNQKEIRWCGILKERLLGWHCWLP
jgi:hypothetical protein